MEARAQALLGELRAEALAYNGYSAAELEQLLLQGCMPALQQRAAAAEALLGKVCGCVEGRCTLFAMSLPLKPLSVSPATPV